MKFSTRSMLHLTSVGTVSNEALPSVCQITCEGPRLLLGIDVESFLTGRALGHTRKGEAIDLWGDSTVGRGPKHAHSLSKAGGSHDLPILDESRGACFGPYVCPTVFMAKWPKEPILGTSLRRDSGTTDRDLKALVGTIAPHFLRMTKAYRIPQSIPSTSQRATPHKGMRRAPVVLALPSYPPQHSNSTSL